MKAQMPIRIQRKRSKGWKLPENAVIVTRGTMWGNPFVVKPDAQPGTQYFCGTYIAVPTVEDAVDCFRLMLEEPSMKGYVEAVKQKLRGKDLACFCKPGQPCHADILLKVANA